MRYALAALLVASCASPEGRSPLTPTEFHLFGSRSWGDGDGSIGPRGNPDWNLDTSSSSDSWSLGAGFTWLIGPVASSKAMRDLVRELRDARDAPPAALPAPAAPISIEVNSGPLGTAEPAQGDTGGQGTEAPEPGQGPSGPVPVSIESAKADVWIRLIGALALLATAAAGYIGRERIPLVKRYTAKGRAERSKLEDAPPSEE